MGYSEAINNRRDLSSNSFPVFGNTAAQAEPTEAAVSFDRVFRDTHFGSTAQTDDESTAEAGIGTFSAGADVERMSRMSQVKELFFSDELAMFGEDEELDDSIGFDEVEELDLIADDEAASKAAEQPALSEETEGFLESVLSEDDDMSAFADIEDM